MQRLQSNLRLGHCSPRAVEACSAWVTRYVRYCRLRHPGTLGEREVVQFLTHRDSSAGVGYDIHTVQELLGHRDVSTTMLYTHVLNRGGLAVRSSAEVLIGAGRRP